MTDDREKMTTGDWKKTVDRKKKLIEEMKKKYRWVQFPGGDEDMDDPVGEERAMAATREHMRRDYGWT